MMRMKLRDLLNIRRSREERSSGDMVLTVTEDTPADMLAGSMELLVQLPRDHNVHTQRVTVPRSTPMMDLLVQIATAHKLSASSYTLQAIGERGLVLPHQPNTPIGALDALQVKLLPKQGTFLPRKAKQANQPFETTFRLQVLLPRNQLYVSRVSPKTNLGKILEEVCREKNLDKNKYELRHPANLEETLDLSLSLQDYHLQEVTLYAKQGRTLGAALSSQDIMALQRQEERRRQQAKQSVFGFMFRKSKESSLSIDSLGGRSVSPARSDETGRSVSPLAPPSRPLRKRRPAPKPPVQMSISSENDEESKLVISHSRNSSDSSGYHEASVLSDNPDSSARMPETLPRRSKPPCKIEIPRKLAQTSQASKSLGNLAMASGGLSHAVSSSSISSTGVRKKRAAPPPPMARPLSSAISTQALERIVDSEESLTSDIDISKSPSDIAASSKANSDIGGSSKANSDIGVHSMGSKPSSEIGYKIDAEFRAALADHEDNSIEIERHPEPMPDIRLKSSSGLPASIAQPKSDPVSSLEKSENVETPRIVKRANGDRSSDTELLLQKVSDTLSNTIPISEPPLPQVIVAAPVSAENMSKVHLTETIEPVGNQPISEASTKECEPKPTTQTERKICETFLSARSIATTSLDATLNSQQDTSDYVSATGDDLSLTDWEYQLPAPPSAFRDNVSPDFNGYDTITLRSIEAFKETSSNTPEHEKIPILGSSARQSPVLRPKEIAQPSTPLVKRETELQRSMSTETPCQQEKPKPNPDVFPQSRSVDVTTELKKDIISELSTKIESGSLPRMNGRLSEQDGRKTTNARSAPKIAPIDNTLSNFTITTYSRKKSLNIFEDEANEEKRDFPKLPNTANKDRGSETSTTSKESIENGKGHFDSKITSNRVEDDFSRNGKLSVDSVDSEDRVIKPQEEFKKPEIKIHQTQHDSLLRHSTFCKGQGKSTNVYRSKSYVSLANNSKYREDPNGERDNGSRNLEKDDSRIMKATSVTNLNQDAPRTNEKFSQWRENILKRQEEPSEEKQLQSLQILKNILPRLKSNQQTEENVPDAPNEKDNSIHTGSKISPEVESVELQSVMVGMRTEVAAATPQKPADDATMKRYKYAGPPAISLGSWSERPRVNVQLKMDTDYKFATSNNTSCVNINGTSNEKKDQKQTKQNTLPRNFSDNSATRRTISHEETMNTRRESEDALSKKLITHTTATGFKKPASNRIVFSEMKKMSQNTEVDDKPIVTSIALKKTPVEEDSYPRTDNREPEDDVKIDTKPVDFRELSKTFGQEVCLRAKPKRILLNRHSDYYGTRPDMIKNSPNTVNGQASVWETANRNALKHADSMRNQISNGTPSVNHGTTRRYTSVVGIQSHNDNYRTETVESVAKRYTTTTKMNGLMPVVKGFKISTSQNEANVPVSRVRENDVLTANSSLKVSNIPPPPPPTMPIITGVTLKNSTARPKSAPICNVDPRDQLLESIRNFGGRGGLRSMRS